MKLCATCHRSFPDETAGCPDHGDTLKPDAMLGLRLGPFVVSDWLAEGGLGVVYRGEHVEIRRPVAVKVLKRELVTDEAAISRFFREARAVSKIAHPHLIDIFDLGTTPDGRVYYVMELLEGRSLADRMARAPLSFEEFLPLMKDASEALEAAHAVGIIHRDLKPDNLFLVERAGEPPFVKVLDFGVAKVLGTDQDVKDRLTRTGNILGTPQYMAPEQIEGEPVDRRTDVYALGVILYELATRSLPFRAQTLGGMLKAHLLDSPPLFEAGHLAPGVPRDLEGVVLKALRKAPGDRYASMGELRAELERVASGTPTEASAWWMAQHAAGTVQGDKLPAYLAGSVQPTLVGNVDPATLAALKQQQPPRAPSRARALVMSGVVVAALAGGGVVAYRRWSAPPPPPPDTHPVTAPVVKTPNTAALRSRALAAITAALKDGDPAVRKQAITALTDGHDPRHRSLVEPLLADADLGVRAQAASALAKLGVRAAIPTLRPALGAAPRIDCAVAEALFKLGDDSVRKPLQAALKKGDETRRICAALILADGDAEARKLLARRAAKLDFEDPVGAAILERLARTDAASRAKIAAQLTQGSPAMQIAAAQALGGLGDDRGRDRLTQLASEDSPARLLAYRGLAMLDDQTGFDLFRRTFADGSRPPGERVVAAQGLAASGEKSALAVLEPALDAEEPALRLAACGAVLGILASDPKALAARSVDWATAALADEYWSVREQAVTVLADAEPSVAVPLLGKALHDEQPEVRRAAASSLGRTRAASAVNYLDEALKDKQGDVRMVALNSLGKIKHPSVAPVLSKHLAHASKPERVVAAGELARLGDKSHLQEVKDGLNASEPEIRKLAVEAAAADPTLGKDAATGALKDSVFAVRFAAALHLANEGAKDGVAVLQEGIKQGGLQGMEALGALSRLGVKPEAQLDPEAVLSSGDAQQRADVVAAGAKLPPAQASAFFKKALDDSEARVRLAAVEALADLDDAPARIALLKHALADADPAVRAKAGILFARFAPPPKAEPQTAAPAVDLAAAPDLSTAPDLARAPDLALPVDLAQPDLTAPRDLAPATGHDEEDEGSLAMTSGEIALKAGRFDVAIRELQRAHRLSAKLPVFFSLGEAYRKLGDRETDHVKQQDAYTKAIVAYQKAHEKRAATYAAELQERLKNR
jgi:serine/threonine-protein kinase